jgi:hypothetical protein
VSTDCSNPLEVLLTVTDCSSPHHRTSTQLFGLANTTESKAKRTRSQPRLQEAERTGGVDGDDGREVCVYHRATVIERVDDFAAQSLDYYASRRETPLVWGGSGAGDLGLGVGRAVTPAEYEALFAPGGGRDPASGVQLVFGRAVRGWRSSSLPTSRWPSSG